MEAKCIIQLLVSDNVASCSRIEPCGDGLFAVQTEVMI